MHCANGKISLPTFGLCRLKEKDYPPEKRFTSVTVSTRAGRWFVSVPDEMASNASPNLSQDIIGIDLGIRHLATLSSGEVFHAPNTDRLEKRLKRYQRQFARQKPQSNNKAKTRKTIQGLHFQIANQRTDTLHKLTSFVVKTKRPKRIVIEDLNVKGMLKTPPLAKGIAHMSFFEFRRQLTYKAKQNGVELWSPTGGSPARKPAQPAVTSTVISSGATRRTPAGVGCRWTAIKTHHSIFGITLQQKPRKHIPPVRRKFRPVETL